MAGKAFDVPFEEYTSDRLSYYLDRVGLECQELDLKAQLFIDLQSLEQTFSRYDRAKISVFLESAWKYDQKAKVFKDLLTNLYPQFQPPLSKLSTVCLEDHPFGNFPARRITENCQHRSSICLTCLRLHIRFQMDDNAIDNIQCPSCPSTLTPNDIRTWADDELFETYCERGILEYLQGQPDFYRCLGPNCGSGQIHDYCGGMYANTMTCQSCLFRTCVRHGTPWHPGRTCDQVDEAQQIVNAYAENERLMEVFFSETTKECAGCHTKIFKSGGCDHMACEAPGCIYQFCWVCLLPWAEARLIHGNFHVQTR